MGLPRFLRFLNQRRLSLHDNQHIHNVLVPEQHLRNLNTMKMPGLLNRATTNCRTDERTPRTSHPPFVSHRQMVFIIVQHFCRIKRTLRRSHPPTLSHGQVVFPTGRQRFVERSVLLEFRDFTPGVDEQRFVCHMLSQTTIEMPAVGRSFTGTNLLLTAQRGRNC